MSQVTNVMVMVSLGYEFILPVLNEISRQTSGITFDPFVPLSDAGGNKRLEAVVCVAAINYLDDTRWIEAVRQTIPDVLRGLREFTCGPGYVDIVLEGQEGDRHRLHFTNNPVFTNDPEEKV